MWINELLTVLAVKACPNEQKAAQSFIKNFTILLQEKLGDMEPMTLFGIITDINKYVQASNKVKSNLTSFAAYCLGIASLHAKHAKYNINPEWIQEYPELQCILLVKNKPVVTQMRAMENNALSFLQNPISVDFDSWLLVLDQLLPQTQQPNVLLMHLYSVIRPYLVKSAVPCYAEQSVDSDRERYLLLKGKIQRALYSKKTNTNLCNSPKKAGILHYLAQFFQQPKESIETKTDKEFIADRQLAKIRSKLQNYCYVSSYLSIFNCCTSARTKMKVSLIIDLIDNKALTTVENVVNALQTVRPTHKGDKKLQDIISSIELLIDENVVASPLKTA